MKKYLLKIVLGALVLIVLHYAILSTLRGPIPAAYPMRELFAIKQYLIAKQSSPKVIFVGGSNVLMGIDAKEIEKDTGRPTFNLGLQAGLRLEDILAQASRAAQAGDTVVLALEPEYYQQSEKWSDWQLRNGLSWNYTALDSKSFTEKWKIYFEASTPLMAWDLLRAKLLQHIMPSEYKNRIADTHDSDDKIVKRILQEAHATSFAYSVSNLDDHGDAINTAVDRIVFWGAGTPLTLPDAISDYSKERLTKFLTDMKLRHVRVYFAHTPYVVDGKARDTWKKPEENFKKELNDMGGELLDARDQLFIPEPTSWTPGFISTPKAARLIPGC